MARPPQSRRKRPSDSDHESARQAILFLGEVERHDPLPFRDFERHGVFVGELAFLSGFRRVISAYRAGYKCGVSEATKDWDPPLDSEQLPIRLTASLLRRLYIYFARARSPFDAQWEIQHKRERLDLESKRQEAVGHLRSAEALLESGNRYRGGLSPDPMETHYRSAPAAEITRLRAMIERLPLECVFTDARQWLGLRMSDSSFGMSGRAADPKYAPATTLIMFARDLGRYVPERLAHRSSAIRDLINFAVKRRSTDSKQYPDRKIDVEKVSKALAGQNSRESNADVDASLLAWRPPTAD